MAMGESEAKRKESNLEPLLTSAEAANILRVNPKVLERWAKAGEIPAFKVGKFWRYRSSDLDEWVSSRLANTASIPPPLNPPGQAVVESGRQACRMRPSF
jgi:excisionase family DNA binding protein